MKKTFIFLSSAFILFSTTLAAAEVPTAMQFQGYLTDTEGAPLSGSHSITFTIYGSENGDDAVWTTVMSVTAESGVFSVELGGEGNPLDSNVFSGSEALWLGVKIGDDAELTPRSPISAVPYATHAATADNALNSEQIQGLIDQGGFLTEFSEEDPTVNTLAKAVLSCGANEIAKWTGEVWDCMPDAIGLEVESDPMFTESPAFDIADEDINNWNACFGWGNHSEIGYLTEFIEQDPSANALAKALLDCGNGEVVRYNGAEWECSEDVNTDTLADLDCAGGETAVWNTENSVWECGAVVLSETDPVYINDPAFGITSGAIDSWNVANGWGNHADGGYLKSYTETDPIYINAPAFGITSGVIDNWNAANGWGDHGGAGYAFSSELSDSDPATTPVNWSDLANTPGGFADGTDDVIDDAYANLGLEGRLNFTETDDLVTKEQLDGELGNYASATLAARMRQTPGYQTIQSGSFLMGSPSGELGRYTHETQHWVTLSYRFEMKMTEVTQAEFEALMGYNPSHFSDSGSGETCGPDCPVERISWHEALAYANAKSLAEGFDQCFHCTGTAPYFTCGLKADYTKPQDCPGYRLPTEAEWEYAARAGTATAFYSGDITSTTSDPNMDAIGWYGYNSDTGSGRMTHPVGEKQPNLWGLKDMSGNVLELVWDWYCADNTGYGDDPDGSTCVGSGRVLRGSFWISSADYCRSAVRGGYSPGNRGYEIGARLCRSRP